MVRQPPRVRGCVTISLADPGEARALAEALTVEAENPPDEERGSVAVDVRGDTVRVCFTARDPSSARAILNAYLSLAAATVEALRRLDRGGHSARG